MLQCAFLSSEAPRADYYRFSHFSFLRYSSIPAPQLLVILGRQPEVIEQCQLRFVVCRVCSRPKPVANLVAPATSLCRVHDEVVAFEIQKAVPLGGHPQLALQPSGSACCSVAQLGFTPFRPFVVAAHLLGADAPDVEALVQIGMLHDVVVADLLVAAHLAG